MAVITQKMIAEATGFSIATVSRALQDSPQVSDETKASICETAETMGYVADPMLSALVNYRVRGNTEYNKVCVLSAHDPEDDWANDFPSGRAIMQGIREGCQDYGFEMELFHLHKVNGNLDRMLEILSARGIETVILLPTPATNSDAYGTQAERWKDFLIVRIEYNMDIPPSHYVCSNHFDSVTTLWDELTHRGYKRIGLEVRQNALDRVHGIWAAAYHWRQLQTHPPKELIPALIHDELTKECVLEYLQEYQLDAIIGRVRRVPLWIRESGIRVPEDVGWAGLDLQPEEEEFAGIVQQRKEQGRSAVTLLHRLKMDRQFGALPYERGVMHKGIWKEGKTVRSVPPVSVT